MPHCPANNPRCKKACKETGQNCTFDAADSFVQNVVDEFKLYNNTVDVFVSAEHCKLFPLLSDRYFRDGLNVSYFELNESRSQGDGINQALDWYLNVTTQSTHDLFILTRSDVVFKQSLLASEVLDFSRMNYASPCEGRTFGPKCVFDIFMAMPRSFVAPFRNASCFDVPGPRRGEHGHTCRYTLEPAIALAGLEEGFTFWAKPAGAVRAPNPWYSLCPPGHH